MAGIQNPLVRIENGIYQGSNERNSLYDLMIPENFNGKLVVFIHGYKGFKDWGAWNLVQFEFVTNGFGFAKINLSHNGGTIENPIDFPDLEAFSFNTYSKEVDDIKLFLSHLDSLTLPEHSTHLIGHSRGGGDVIIASSEDERIDSFTTWASIASIEKRMPNGELLEKWKNEGVRYEKNTRTGQLMPINYTLFDDFLLNYKRLNIESACGKIRIPRLLIHGTNDESVDISEGQLLASWLNTPLIEIPNANHTFGSHHPWETFLLPPHLNLVVDLTMRFFSE